MSRAAIMRPMDEAASAGQLALQHCEACGAGQYPPSELCHACLSDRLAWSVTGAASGVLLAQATLHHSFEPTTALPRRVGLVRLERGVSAVCFVADHVEAGPVSVRAELDGTGRTILVAC